MEALYQLVVGMTSCEPKTYNTEAQRRTVLIKKSLLCASVLNKNGCIGSYYSQVTTHCKFHH